MRDHLTGPQAVEDASGSNGCIRVTQSSEYV